MRLARGIGAVVLLIGTGAFVILLYIGIAYFGLRPVAIWEYGEAAPGAEVFSPRREASYTLPPAAKLQKGWQRLKIEIGGWERSVFLYVQDTVAPNAASVEKTISTLVELTPDQMIAGLKDADVVKVSYAAKPPFGTVGDYETTILLEDASGNRNSVTSLLHIRVTNEAGVTMEAGSPAPAAEAFLIDAYEPETMTEITDAMLRSPGEHPISITIDGRTYDTMLTVVDTVPPAVSTDTVFTPPETVLTPEMFLQEVSDETETTAEFLIAPDPEVRDFQQVEIRVTDAGGNHTDVSAGLLFTRSQPIIVEARKTPLTEAECLPDVEYVYAAFVRTFVPDTIGSYAITLYVDEEPELALVEVRDTTPPKLLTGAVQGYLAHPMEAAALCEIEDATETTVVFESEVDWNCADEQEVFLIATDAAGNEARGSVFLTLIPDTEPPVLYGVKPRYAYLDEAISYLEGITAIDAADGEVAVTVDTSSVNTARTGTFFVRYTATDAAGNTVSKRTTITIKRSSVSEEKLDRYVQRIMAEITTEDMTLADKVFAIYDYVRSHVKYSARSDKTDWRKEALRGIQKGRGDCYTSNSLARALLETTDAEVFVLQRSSYNTHHYWLLVNVGTGWYHFDATDSREHRFRCCMWTDAQCSVNGRFWGYEKNAAPLVATERFDREKAAAAEAEWAAAHRQATENEA